MELLFYFINTCRPQCLREQSKTMINTPYKQINKNTEINFYGSLPRISQQNKGTNPSVAHTLSSHPDYKLQEGVEIPVHVDQMIHKSCKHLH